MQTTFRVCETSVDKYVQKQRACIQELAVLRGTPAALTAKENCHSDEWCSFEFKRGKIATLREQKSQTLKTLNCAVCGEHVSNCADFLSSVDRQICALENDLHIHAANR
ncbi:Uncharacterized protein SCF082_LOCUS35924 [Durusdinium trenchii]|uniref:Uncharacterized protein n=1 Tax=Durusdinium trenchii TaxID=1381693 RepID=A0ABP0PCE4_9DINO